MSLPNVYFDEIVNVCKLLVPKVEGGEDPLSVLPRVVVLLVPAQDHLGEPVNTTIVLRPDFNLFSPTHGGYGKI